MSDIRSLLKNERAARRIQHKHASYSTAGTLMCLVCRLQLKSESLWEGHLRSPGHIMRLSKQQELEQKSPTLANADGSEGNNKKRKASDEEETVSDTLRKRSKASNSIPERLDPTQRRSESPAKSAISHEMQFPSRPATPSKTRKASPKQPTVDEDEWAAFEADVAAVEVPVELDAVISAPAMTAAEIEARSLEEANAKRKEKAEAELEGDKEDAQQKLQDEFEEMESLEQRVKQLREKREALRRKEIVGTPDAPEPVQPSVPVEEDEEDDDEDDDEWDGFRLR